MKRLLALILALCLMLLLVSCDDEEKAEDKNAAEKKIGQVEKLDPEDEVTADEETEKEEPKEPTKEDIIAKARKVAQDVRSLHSVLTVSLELNIGALPVTVSSVDTSDLNLDSNISHHVNETAAMMQTMTTETYFDFNGDHTLYRNENGMGWKKEVGSFEKYDMLDDLAQSTTDKYISYCDFIANDPEASFEPVEYEGVSCYEFKSTIDMIDESVAEAFGFNLHFNTLEGYGVDFDKDFSDFGPLAFTAYIDAETYEFVGLYADVSEFTKRIVENLDTPLKITSGKCYTTGVYSLHNEVPDIVIPEDVLNS